MNMTYKPPTIDDLRHHTELATGFTKDAMLNIAADWIEALQAELEASPPTDTVTLELSRKIMREIQAMTYPVDVQRMPQLQAKIQCLLEEALDSAKGN